jgi:hypothetical protein
MQYCYEWPLDFPHPVLNEALEIALNYLQGTGQAKTRDGAEHRVAAAILTAWSHGIKHHIRLAPVCARAFSIADGENRYPLRNELALKFL